MRFKLWWAIILALNLFLPAKGLANVEKENLWPFWDRRQDVITKAKDTGLLGPLIFTSEKEEERQYGFRPFFSVIKDRKEDTTRLDILFPLATYRREGKDKRFQLFQLFTIRSEETEAGAKESGLNLFPFVFYKSHEQGYFALFPFYGTLKNRFWRDEITFYMFPFYSTSRRADVQSLNIFWPFYNSSKGEKQWSWRLWPFYGASEKEGSFSKRFYFWPFGLSQKTGLDTDNPRDFFAILPFYASLESPEQEYTSLLWPFFTHLKNKKREYEEWDLPLPFFVYAQGVGRRAFRLWPLAGKDERPDSYSFFLLWPLFIHSQTESEDLFSTRNRIFFFLYSDLEVENRTEETTLRRLEMWPLFTYKREADGSQRFQFLSLLEPFLPGNEGVERNLSPLWALYRYRADGEGRVVHSVLWNLVRKESGPDYSQWEVLGPVISRTTRGEQRESLSILKGLVEFGRAGGKSYLKLFYIKLPGFW